MTLQDYKNAVDWLFLQAPNYQSDGLSAYKPGLENIKKLCAFFGNPQDYLKMIHIGGTNGKGSTSNMLSSVLQESGYKVGVYNSPHLIDFTERIKINSENCNKNFVFEFILKLKKLPSDIQPSFFEFTTIMAFEYFFQQKVDYAIIEVGLGGKLDSTNIIRPLVSAITNVDLDHQIILGNSIEEIAMQKAGIIKENTSVILGGDNSVVKQIIQKEAREKKSNFIDAAIFKDDLESDLKGKYQKKNIKVVLALVDELKKSGLNINSDNVKKGLLNVSKNTNFIGRWFEFSNNPLTICDTGHNKAGLDEVFNQLNEYNSKKHVVLGFVNDKKIDEVLEILPREAEYYFVKPSIERGRNPKSYEDLLINNKINYKLFKNVQEGYLSARQSCKDGEMIFVGGSNFVVGEFLEKNLLSKY